MRSRPVPKGFLRYALVSALVSAFALPATAQEGAWTDVFNGTDLTGLKKHGNGTVTVVAADKVIDVTGGSGYLYTDKDYTHYRARVEWKNIGHGNCGYLHNIDLTKHSCGDWPSGPELQMLEGDVGSIWTTDCKFNTTGSGLNYSPTGGALAGVGQYGCGRTHFVTKETQEKVGEWNAWEIYVNGDSLEAKVNGKVVLRISKLKSGGDLAMIKGRMGLQIEGAHVQWRNWQVMDLTVTPVIHPAARGKASAAQPRAGLFLAPSPGAASGVRFTREGLPPGSEAAYFTASGKMTLVPAP